MIAAQAVVLDPLLWENQRRPSHVDAAPLARLLQRVLDPYGHWPEEWTQDTLGRACGYSSGRRIFELRHERQRYVSLDVADRICVTLGLHIAEVYPDYYGAS